jgi:hypothetical protein
MNELEAGEALWRGEKALWQEVMLDSRKAAESTASSKARSRQAARPESGRLALVEHEASTEVARQWSAGVETIEKGAFERLQAEAASRTEEDESRAVMDEVKQSILPSHKPRTDCGHAHIDLFLSWHGREKC